MQGRLFGLKGVNWLGSVLVAYVNVDKCIGCGKCTGSCVNNAIQVFQGKAVVIDFNCLGCFYCVAAAACPKQAIETKPRFSYFSEEEKLRVQASFLIKQINIIKGKLKKI